MSRKYTFVPGTKIPDLKFATVHALLVTADMRVLLRYKSGEPRVAGGHIESTDENLVAALRREVYEEANCEIDRYDYVGYIEMYDEASGTREFWARMVARISQILPARPDSDRSDCWIYGRELVPPKKALALMTPLFATNSAFLPAALKVAEANKYYILPPNTTCEMINPESHTP